MFKYPRTPHFEWSLGATNDDKILKSTKSFEGKQVVVSEKMDGECSGVTRDNTFARSLDSADHPSRHWLKNKVSEFQPHLAASDCIYVENVFAEHSIPYKNLLSYFYVISFWIRNECLSWEDTEMFCSILNIPTVPIIYKGMWDEDLIRNIKVAVTEKGDMEGYVVRIADSFEYNDFSKCVAKFVRANHVQTDEHWMNKPLVKNKLKKDLYG